MRLQSVEIPVRDMDRAYYFYSRVLEFPPISRTADFAMLFIGDVHGGMVTLLKRPESATGQGPGLVLTANGGVPPVRAELEAKGVEFLGPTESRGLGPIARFLDSEGNHLAICEPNPTVRFRVEGKRPVAELRDELRNLEERAAGLLDGVSESHAQRKPAGEDWSVTDQVGHVVDSLDSGREISLELAAGQKPREDRLWSEHYPAESFSAARAALRRAFASIDTALNEYPVAPNLDASLPHGVFGSLNALEWIAFTVFHVDMHVRQIEAIAQGPDLGNP